MATSALEDYTRYRSTTTVLDYTIDDLIGREDARDDGLNTVISETYTNSALIKTGMALFRGILVSTDGSNNAVFTVYNGTNASGVAITNTNYTIPGSNYSGSVGFDPPIPCGSGIYVTFSGTGASYKVFYGD